VPVVFERSACVPVAVLLSAVLKRSACQPVAVLCFPVVFE
jgi:hypothetical protein